MKQVIISRYGPPEVLKIRENQIPEPGDHEVLIRVHYAGINFSEIMARMKLYPGAPKPPTTLGSEASGIIEKVGSSVTGFKPGDKVMSFCRFGSYSTHICVSEQMVFALPERFTLDQGAAFPLVYVTAFMMIYDLGNIQPGEAVLIHGAGGAVGTAAIQLIKHAGAGIIGTSSGWKHEKLKKMGVKYCIDYRKENVYDKVMECTQGAGVDLIIDPLGGKSWKNGYRMLAPMGKLIVYGDQKIVSGFRKNPFVLLKELFTIPKFNPALMLGENKCVMGYHLGKLRNAEHKIQNAVDRLMKIVDTGKLNPVIDRIFHYTEAPECHRYIQERKNFGKVLLDFRKE